MHKTRDLMTQVVIALIPALLAKTYFWGIGTLLALVVGLATAVLAEIVSCVVRNLPWQQEIKNRSAVVTIFILTLSLPPALPYYVIIVLSLCAIILAKQFYGGMGQNLFNPAMVAMAIFIVSYPQYLGAWYLPNNNWLDLGTQWDIFWAASIDGQQLAHAQQALQTASQAGNEVANAIANSDANAVTNLANQATEATQQAVQATQDALTASQQTGIAVAQNTTNLDLTARYGIDGVTQATPLTEIKGMSHGMQHPDATLLAILGNNYWHWLIYQLAFIIGGAYLLAKKIISWQLPVYTLIGFVLVSLLHYLVTGAVVANPLYSLVMGSIIFGAFFIVTDPVSCPQYGWAKIVYPVAIGALAYIIRAFTNYNDGVAFAVIFMNMLVPFFDQVSRPKEYGK